MLSVVLRYRLVTEKASLNLTPKFAVPKIGITEEMPAAKPTCSRCQDDTAAVKYCIDCRDKICDQHLKVSGHQYVQVVLCTFWHFSTMSKMQYMRDN